MTDEHEKMILAFTIALLRLYYSTPEMVASFLEEERQRIESSTRLDDEFIRSLRGGGRSGAAQEIAVALSDSLKYGPSTWEELEAEAYGTIAYAEAQGVFILHPYYASYPKRLLRNRPYPPILYCRGDPSAVESNKVVTIVGTDTPTRFGERMALRFAQLLSDDGYSIVIEAGAGTGYMRDLGTSYRAVAVFREPIDGPSLTERGRQFADAVLGAGGAVVSELAPGTGPLRWSDREAIVFQWELAEALSDGVVVTEIGFHDRSWHVIERAIVSGKPVAAFDYRRSERLRFAFETEPRFEGDMFYLSSNRGVSPIFGPETVDDFRSRVESYRAQSDGAPFEGRRRGGGDHLLNATLKLAKTLCQVDDGSGCGQVGIDECAQELALRVAYMMHGEDLAWRRRRHRPDIDLRHGTCGTCSWACDSEGLLFVYPTNGVSGLLEPTSSLTGWPWLEYETTRTYEMDHADTITCAIIDEGVAAPPWLYHLLYGCGRLVCADLSNLDVSSTSMVSPLSRGCHKLANLDLSGWDISGIESLDDFFGGCDSLVSLCIAGWDTSGVSSMRNTFRGCESLTRLDLSGWDTSSAKSMGGMFWGCAGLTSLDLSSWDTSSVVDKTHMFSGCRTLRNLDLSGLDTSSVVDKTHMFSGCLVLEPLDLSSWDTSSTKSMGGMIWECAGLTSLDLSSWDTSSVVDMRYMFYGCSGLTSLDISGWDTSHAMQVNDMFEGCTGLMTISVGTSFDVTKAFPKATSENGKWWSRLDGCWYSVDEIKAERFGVADTYCIQPCT